MAADGAGTDDLPITREQWRALRRIRRLQLVSTAMFAAGLAGGLIALVTIICQFSTPAAKESLYLQLADLPGWAMMCAAWAGWAIASGLLGRTLCPRCGHVFFPRRYTVRSKRAVATGNPSQESAHSGCKVHTAATAD
jgi:hypothetical protein